METLNIEIYGTPSSDMLSITEILDALTGVKQTIINERTGQIIYDPAVILSETILKKIKDSGYEAQVVTDAE